MAVIVTLTLSLIYAHYVMYGYIQKLNIIHNRYQNCMQLMKDVDIKDTIPPFAEQLDRTPDDVEEACENDISFIPLNRAHNYLRESTMDFFRSEHLDDVLRNINQNEWQEYTNQTLEQMATPSIIKHPKIQQKRRTVKKTPVASLGHIFQWPISRGAFWLSSFFGPRSKRNGIMGFHYGIDMAAVKGTLVRAAAGGTVIEAHHSRGYGNTVVIQHSAQFKTRYAHLDSICVHTGQKISANTIIGRVGETGYIRKRSRDGSHLHFEVYDKGKRVNPLHYLPPF